MSQPPMSLPPPLCPNCQTPWPPDAEFCPNCGLQRPLPTPGSTWPPPPSNFVSPVQPPVPKLVTGRAWGDIVLGVGLTLVSVPIYCLGLAVMPILYFTLKPTYPVFTRGIGYGLLAVATLLLGAFAWCLSSGFAGWHP